MSTCKCNDVTCPVHLAEQCENDVSIIASQPASAFCPDCASAQSSLAKLQHDPQFVALQHQYADAKTKALEAWEQLEIAQRTFRVKESEAMRRFTVDAEQQYRLASERNSDALHHWADCDRTLTAAGKQLVEYARRKSTE